jgi:hypothetical protein
VVAYFKQGRILIEARQPDERFNGKITGAKGKI